MTEPPAGIAQYTYVRDGLTLGYSVVGDGQPILCVHGATATGTFEWNALASKLSGAGYRCILPDLRGHGRSQFRSADIAGEAICADLRHLIDHLGLRRPHIVGFSYGAEIALTLELSTPGIARSLALISPGTGRPSDYRVPRLESLHRHWPFALRRLHNDNHGPDHWRELVAALHQDSVSRPELSSEVLAEVGCPILLMAGDHDEPTRQNQGRRFAELNPRARYVEIVGAAHAAHQECPDMVAQVVGDFLAEVDLEKAGPPWHGQQD